MLRSMNSAISGMQAFQNDLDVVGNNIANVNTVGYKSSRTDFSDVLSQTLSGGNGGTAGKVGGTNPMQIGLGVQTSDISMNMQQGPDQTTGNPTDLAIQGSGFFVASPDPSNATPQKFLTRAGNFTVDNSNNLVLPNGMVAMGYLPAAGGAAPTLPATLQAVNLNTLFTNSPTTNIAGLTIAKAPDPQIGSDGSLSVMGSDGQRYTIGYLALGTVANPAGLSKMGGSMFQASSSSGPLALSMANDPTSNTGSLAAGELEQSNVNLSNEFSEMIVAENGFVANSHMIGTDNRVLQALVNMRNS